MKNCIVDKIKVTASLDDKQISVDITGAEGFEVAVYFLADTKKIHEIWYTEKYFSQIVIENAVQYETIQAQVFVRFDGEDKEPKSKKSNTINIGQPETPKDLNNYEILTKALIDRVQLQSLKSQSLKPFLNSSEYLDKDARSTAYQFFFKEIHTLKIENNDFFSFAVMDGFWTLCNSGYGWVGEHGSSGIPPFSWYEKIEEALEFYFASENLAGYAFHMIKGVIASVREDWGVAEEHFKKSKYPANQHMGHFFRGSASFRHPLKCLRPKTQILDFSKVITPTRNDINTIPSSYENDVFVFSAEPNYFNKFALQIVASSLEQNLKADYLFFIVGETDLCLESINELDELCAEHNRKCYYITGSTPYELLPVAATARFIAAHEILNRTNCQAFVFDIDMFITPEMAEDIVNISEAKKLALSLKTNGVRSFPWTNIAAAGTFLPQNQYGLFYAQAVCNYFIDAISDEQNNWWIDQNALFAAYKQFRSLYYNAEIINMHATTGKGLTKNDDSNLLKWKRTIKKTSTENN